MQLKGYLSRRPPLRNKKDALLYYKVTVPYKSCELFHNFGGFLPPARNLFRQSGY